MRSLDELEKTLLQLKSQIAKDRKKIEELEEIIKNLYEYNAEQRSTNSSSTRTVEEAPRGCKQRGYKTCEPRRENRQQLRD